MKKGFMIIFICLFLVQTVSAYSYSPYYGNSYYSTNHNFDYLFPERSRNVYVEPANISFQELKDLRRNRYGYLDARDLALFYAYADDDSYDKFDRAYYEDLENVLDDFYCITLDQYNELAGLDNFDRYDIIELDNLDYDIIDRDFLQRFNLEDYNTIAQANHYDSFDPIDTNYHLSDLDWDDMTCWDLDDYNYIADLNIYDKWDNVDFTDFDDLELLTKIGRGRVDFFDQDDFDDFDLDQTVVYNIGYRRALWFPNWGTERADLSPFFAGSGGFYGNDNVYIPAYYDNGLGLSETSFNPNFVNDFEYLVDYNPRGMNGYVRDYTRNSLSYNSRDIQRSDVADPSARFKYGYGYRRPMSA